MLRCGHELSSLRQLLIALDAGRAAVNASLAASDPSSTRAICFSADMIGFRKKPEARGAKARGREVGRVTTGVDRNPWERSRDSITEGGVQSFGREQCRSLPIVGAFLFQGRIRASPGALALSVWRLHMGLD
jgi:hypothetical protein